MAATVLSAVRSGTVDFVDGIWTYPGPSGGYFYTLLRAPVSGLFQSEDREHGLVSATGTLTWSARTTLSLGGGAAGWGSASNGSKLAVLHSDPNTLTLYIRVYDSTGATVWTRALNALSFNQDASMAMDSTGAVFIILAETSVGYEALVKLSGTDGSIVWSAPLWTTGMTSSSFAARGLRLTSGGDPIISFQNGTDAAPLTCIGRFANSSGSRTWLRRISGVYSTGSILLALDSTDNIYGVDYLSDQTTIALVKLDSSGTFVWSKNIASTAATGDLVINQIVASTSGVHFSWLELTPTRKMRVATVQTDGSACAVADYPAGSSMVSNSQTVSLSSVNGANWLGGFVSTLAANSYRKSAIVVDTSTSANDGQYGTIFQRATTTGVTITTGSTTVSTPSTQTYRTMFSLSSTTTSGAPSTNDAVVTFTAESFTSGSGFTSTVGTWPVSTQVSLNATAVHTTPPLSATATGFGPLISLGTPTSTPTQNGAPTGFRNTLFGLVGVIATGPPSNFVTALTGWSSTTFGTVGTLSPVTTPASGFTTTTFGAATALRSGGVTGFTSTAFGTVTHGRGQATSGFSSTALGTPTLSQPIAATGFLSSAYGTPSLYTALFSTPTGFNSTTFGSTGKTQAYFCWPTPPTANFGTPLLIRTNVW